MIWKYWVKGCNLKMIHLQLRSESNKETTKCVCKVVNFPLQTAIDGGSPANTKCQIYTQIQSENHGGVGGGADLLTNQPSSH